MEYQEIEKTTDIDRAWELLMAYKANVRVAVQVSPAVRVAIGEAFGLSRGEDVLAKISTALKTLGADLVLDGAIANDVLVYDLAKEVEARIATGGALPVIYCKGKAAALRENQALAPYLMEVRSPMQALAVAIKRAYLGDGKRTFVIAIEPCLCKKEIAKTQGLRKGEQPAVDLVLSTQELAEMLISADLNLKYVRAGEVDEPFGVASGAGQIAVLSGGVAEGVMRWLSGGDAAELLRVEYSGVRTAKGLREAYVGDKKVIVAASDVDAQAVANAVLAGECDAVFVETCGNLYGCVAGNGQPTDEEETKKLRAYGLYTVDRRAAARMGGENVVALSAAFAADREDDGFEEFTVSLSPFADEPEMLEEVTEAAEIIEEQPVEEVAEEQPVEEVIEEQPVEEVAEAVEVEVEETSIEETEEVAVAEETGNEEDEEDEEEFDDEEMTEEERLKTFDPNYRRMSRKQRRKLKRMRKFKK